jgi:hypothetical protein
MKHIGKRSAGNPHAAFEEAGAGNVTWSRYCDTRKRKGELTGNTKVDLHQRASPRPYSGRSLSRFPCLFTINWPMDEMSFALLNLMIGLKSRCEYDTLLPQSLNNSGSRPHCIWIGFSWESRKLDEYLSFVLKRLSIIGEPFLLLRFAMTKGSCFKSGSLL